MLCLMNGIGNSCRGVKHKQEQLAQLQTEREPGSTKAEQQSSPAMQDVADREMRVRQSLSPSDLLLLRTSPKGILSVIWSGSGKRPLGPVCCPAQGDGSGACDTMTWWHTGAAPPGSRELPHAWVRRDGRRMLAEAAFGGRVSPFHH